MASAPQQYNVGGIVLPRPFKVRRLGHFGFNAVNLAACLTFYHGGNYQHSSTAGTPLSCCPPMCGGGTVPVLSMRFPVDYATTP